MSKDFKQFYLPEKATDAPFENIGGNFVLKTAIQSKNFIANKTGVRIREDGTTMIGENIVEREGNPSLEGTRALFTENIEMLAGLSNKAYFSGGLGDGMTVQNTAGGASITRTIESSYFLTVNGGAGTGSSLSAQVCQNDSFDVASLKFSAYIKLVLTATQQNTWGFTSATFTGTPNNSDAAGFLVNGADLYTNTASGTARTNTQITGITLTNYNKYSVVYTAGLDAKYYVNDILRATDTTNLPNSGTVYAEIWIYNSGAAGSPSAYLKHPFSVLRTD